MDKIDVLDHGFVRLVDSMGSDLSVSRAARVSYDAFLTRARVTAALAGSGLELHPVFRSSRRGQRQYSLLWKRHHASSTG